MQFKGLPRWITMLSCERQTQAGLCLLMLLLLRRASRGHSALTFTTPHSFLTCIKLHLCNLVKRRLLLSPSAFHYIPSDFTRAKCKHFFSFQVLLNCVSITNCIYTVILDQYQGRKTWLLTLASKHVANTALPRSSSWFNDAASN